MYQGGIHEVPDTSGTTARLLSCSRGTNGRKRSQPDTARVHTADLAPGADGNDAVVDPVRLFDDAARHHCKRRNTIERERSQHS
jgi:hypothetical protein